MGSHFTKYGIAGSDTQPYLTTLAKTTNMLQYGYMENPFDLWSDINRMLGGMLGGRSGKLPW